MPKAKAIPALETVKRLFLKFKQRKGKKSVMRNQENDLSI